MKDWLFYPLIILSALIMIAVALYFGRGQTVDTSQGLVLEGAELASLVVAPGTAMEVVTEGGETYAKMQANLRPDEAPSAGVFVAIPTAYQRAYHGRDVQFTIRARAGKQSGVDHFLSGFFSPEGSTDWQSFTVEPTFRDFSYTYQVKQSEAEEDFFYFGIWPDPKGESRVLDVSQMKVKPVSDLDGH